MTWINDFKKVVDVLTSKTALSTLTAVVIVLTYVSGRPTGLEDLALIAIGFLFKSNGNGGE